MSALAQPSAAAAAGVGTARWEALGTGVVLRVCDAEALAQARAAVEGELSSIDRACSRFRGDSELVALNERAGRPARVSALLFEALAVALRAARLSDGDVDPTVGRALELAGYDRDFGLLAPPGQAQASELGPAQPLRLSARVHRGWRTVELNEHTHSVRVPRGITLDLGASAKAWAADRGAAAAARSAGCGALLSIGGDIATSGAAPPGGWRIRVADDHRSDPSAPGQSITIESGGLATSSTAVRRWSHRGRDMHHIIDPSSGEPVRRHWRTVSVAAGDCTDANTAATAAIVRRERAGEWLESEGLPARLVDWHGNITTLAGWPS